MKLFFATSVVIPLTYLCYYFCCYSIAGGAVTNIFVLVNLYSATNTSIDLVLVLAGSICQIAFDIFKECYDVVNVL